MVEILTPDFKFEDERGCLVQLVHEGFHQVNITTAKKGCVRGGHYHKMNREAFYIVSGAIELRRREEEEAETHIFHAGDMFLIPPFVQHDFVFREDTIFVSLYDLGVEFSDGTKDIYRNRDEAGK